MSCNLKHGKTLNKLVKEILSVGLIPVSIQCFFNAKKQVAISIQELFWWQTLTLNQQLVQKLFKSFALFTKILQRRSKKGGKVLKKKLNFDRVCLDLQLVVGALLKLNQMIALYAWIVKKHTPFSHAVTNVFVQLVRLGVKPVQCAGHL